MNDIQKIISRLEKLENAVFGESGSNKRIVPLPSKDVDMSLNERAFIKTAAPLLKIQTLL